MSLDELNSIYVNFKASLEATRLTTKLAIEIFDNFPENLQDKINGGEWSYNILEEFFPALFGDEKEIKKDDEFTINLPYYPAHSGFSTTNSKKEIIENLLDLLGIENLVNGELLMLLKRINYGRLLLSQQLIMYFAHLDAVLMDFFRQVCLISPSILRRDKKISFKEIIDNQDNIINILLDRFAFEFNFKTLEEKINFIKEDIKIDFVMKESEYSLLNRAEQIRHIFVHNAGKIDLNFIKKTDLKEFSEGDFYPLDEKHNEKVYFVMSDIVTGILDGIIKKFGDTLFKD